MNGHTAIIFFVVFLFSCNTETSNTADGDNPNQAKTDTINCSPGNSKLDIQTIEQITGMKGAEKKWGV